ncbi:MAG TPA: hypothetical protein VJP60_05285, partial [Rhizomicrobium sp.]|nr:hypothetical protein [Rhizomicrobium sp.]
AMEPIHLVDRPLKKQRIAFVVILQQAAPTGPKTQGEFAGTALVAATAGPHAKEMLLAGGVFIARRREADMARVQPLRMHAEIILQGSELCNRSIFRGGAAPRLTAESLDASPPALLCAKNQGAPFGTP